MIENRQGSFSTSLMISDQNDHLQNEKEDCRGVSQSLFKLEFANRTVLEL